MKTVDFIRMSLEFSGSSLLALVDDMQDQPLTFPTAKGGNHPLWVLGHLAWAEGRLLHIMLDRTSPLAHWEGIFGRGTEPSADAGRYPTFAEVRKAFVDQRGRTLQFLNELTDADLDRPTKKCPPEMEKFVGTYAKCLMLAIIHAQTHRGQVADARRAIGRKPVMM